MKSTIKYEASKGYVSYQYLKTEAEIEIIFTGTQEETDLQILLPKGKQVTTAFINNKSTNYKQFSVESSNYLHLKVNKKGVY